VYNQASPVRVLLADDAEIIRRGVKTLQEVEPTIRIVGEAAKFTELLSMATELKPDIVVMDLHMPGETEFAPHFISTRLSLTFKTLWLCRSLLMTKRNHWPRATALLRSWINANWVIT
jgi:DNA-binding NarL/FixJ family response regulator